VSFRYVSLAAAITLGAAAPALATAVTTLATQAPAAKPAAAPPQTRANVIKGMDANFKAIDTSGDGALSSAELGAAELKVQQQRIAALRTRVDGEFTKLDINKDGVLSKTEFMAAAPQAPTGAPNGANLLSRLDKNKDGKVSPDEYRAPILSRFDALDTNKDGVISDAERKAAQAAAQRKR
jgi:Ca2+-binding EF-hand superfamily protein